MERNKKSDLLNLICSANLTLLTTTLIPAGIAITSYNSLNPNENPLITSSYILGGVLLSSLGIPSSILSAKKTATCYKTFRNNN